MVKVSFRKICFGGMVTAFNTTKKAFSGQYDRNNRALFNNDVVAIRKGTTPKEKTNCLLTFDEERGSFTFIRNRATV